MQVDQHPSFAMNSAFEDFFNMDLIAGPSAHASSSRASSTSPSTSFSGLPPTPPNPFSIPDINPSPNSFFNFYLDEDFANTKADTLPPPPTNAAPYDFLGAFANAIATQGASPDSGVGSSSSPSSSDSPIGIDPQLVGTPAQSKAPSDFGGDDEDPDLDHEEEEELDEELGFAPPKVGGKGKSARKGTVQSGGIVKKSNSGPLKDKKENNKPAGMMSTTSTEPDDWRPTPEEYKKMSSKEKRQLRNKISARNFRVRRKEYITTLEGDIAERDRLIDVIRQELGSTKSENLALRQEIAALKKALLDGRGRANTPILPPPAPLPAIPAALLASSSAAAAAASPPKSPLLTPNTQKDLPTSPRLGARGFWGGNLGGFGGVTPVHTTLVPEWSSVLSGKLAAAAANARPATAAERRSAAQQQQQENINPGLNNGASVGLGSREQERKEVQLPLNSFDVFAEANPFTLKTLDAYRMQLWTKMGQQQAAHAQQNQNQNAQQLSLQQQMLLLQQHQQQQQQSLNGLAGNLRPHYFAKSPTLSALISGKPSASASASYPTPPPSPPTLRASPALSGPHPNHNQNQQGSQHPTAQHAMLASIASQTLLGKLGSAFWEAFSGSSSGPSSTAAAGGVGFKRELDAEKMRRVLEGKAVVRVVDVEPVSAGVGEKGVGVGEKRTAGEGKSCASAMPCLASLEEGLKKMHL